MRLLCEYRGWKIYLISDNLLIAVNSNKRISYYIRSSSLSNAVKNLKRKIREVEKNGQIQNYMAD